MFFRVLYKIFVKKKINLSVISVKVNNKKKFDPSFLHTKKMIIKNNEINNNNPHKYPYVFPKMASFFMPNPNYH